MESYQLFIIRAVLGIGFALFITRFFFGSINLLYSLGLAIILVGLAYFSEYLKNRKR